MNTSICGTARRAWEALQPKMTGKMKREHCRIHEIAISVRDRDTGSPADSHLCRNRTESSRSNDVEGDDSRRIDRRPVCDMYVISQD